ncbi:MAG: hypothetical protein ACXWTE_05520 [Methylobacter sp.]
MPDSINTIKTRHESRLLSMPGVVSVGIGQNKGHSAIIIDVESQDILDKMALPDQLDGYPVKVQIVDNVRTQ